MTLQQAHYVTCDTCGSPSPVVTESAVEARRVARTEAGFLFYNGVDKCPRCRRDPNAKEVRASLGIPEPGGAA